MGARERVNFQPFLGHFRPLRAKIHVMAKSNAERQRRWRENHPEKADVRFEAFKKTKAQSQVGKRTPTECVHEDRLVRVTLIYCGRCRQLVLVSDHQLENAHKKWESSAPEPHDGE